jgi:arsenite methyltransferase
MSNFEFDEKLAAQLHRLFQTEALQKLRRQYFELFRVNPGELILDVGCGTGANAMALLTHNQGKCRVVGLDNSEPMLAIGRKNLESFSYGSNMSFEVGDGHEIPFPDGHFDAAMIIQVLEYSKEPIRMLTEVKRVLRKGGRLFVADTDWDTVVWNSNQKDRTREIVRLWADHEADGWQGRKIPQYLKEAGFSSLEGGVFVITESSFGENDYCYNFTARIMRDYLVRSEKMSAADVDSWLDDLRAKDRAGHFYFSINRYAFVASSPGLSPG